MTQDGNKGPPGRKKGWLLIGIGVVLGLLLIGGAAAVLDSPYEIGPGVETNETDGPTIHIDETVEPTASDQSPSDGVVDLSPGGRFESNGETYAAVSGWDNDRLVLADLDVSSNELTVTRGRTVSIQGGATQLEMRDYNLGGTAIEVTTSSSTTLTLEVPASDANYVVLTDAATGDVVEAAAGSSDTITTTVSQDRQLVINTRDLVVSDPQPANGSAVSEGPVDLSVDVTTVSDETTDVTFYNASDDSQIGTDQVTGSGTAAVTWSGVNGGANDWYAVATDSRGNSEQIATQTVRVPNTLEIRDESDPTSLITNSTTVEFFGEDGSQSITRTTSDGTIDMQGLPVDVEYVSVAQASGYQDRRIYIEDITEAQAMYLLPDTVDAANIQFELDDFSGEYPQDDTILIVERSINGQWRTVQSDKFSSTGRYEVTLAQEQRHRLIVKNVETGEQRELGAYTPVQATTETITIAVDGSVDGFDQIEQINYQPSLSSIPAASDATITVDIVEGEQAIENWEIVVERIDNGSSTVLDTRTGSGEDSVDVQVDLSDQSGELVATVTYETAAGDQLTDENRWSIRENFEDGMGLLGGVSGVTSALGADSGGATTMLSFLLSALLTGVVAAKTAVSTEIAGFTALGSLTAFWAISWLPATVLFVAMVGFMATAALRRGI